MPDTVYSQVNSKESILSVYSVQISNQHQVVEVWGKQGWIWVEEKLVCDYKSSKKYLIPLNSP